MIVKRYRIGDNMTIGYSPEHQARKIAVYIGEHAAAWPQAEARLLLRRHGDDAPYPVMAERDGNMMVWTVTRYDTAMPGCGVLWAAFIGADDSLLGLAPPSTVQVLQGPEMIDGDTPEARLPPWIVQVIEAAQRIEGGGSAPGADGGYYVPSVDDDGTLRWTASKAGMPEAPEASVIGPVGPQGPKGDTPQRGTDYWTDADRAQLLSDMREDTIGYQAYASPQMYAGTDAQRIQAAIDAHAYVVVPPGSYTIDQTIVVPGDRKLQIEGTLIITCAVGFEIMGSHIDICGNGEISVAADVASCSVIRVPVSGARHRISIRGVSVWGNWTPTGTADCTGVEFVGGAEEGQCCYVNIGCRLSALTRGVYTHAGNDLHADSWLTQVDVCGLIENCRQALVYDWMGDGSIIGGVIQPRCSSSVAPGSVEYPLVVLPKGAQMTAMIWDVDSAINRYAIRIAQKRCTVLTVLDEAYLDIAEEARETLYLRKPSSSYLTRDDAQEIEVTGVDADGAAHTWIFLGREVII